MVFQKESEARQAEGLSYGPAAGLWPSPNHAQRPEAVSCRLCLAGEHRLTGTKAEKKRPRVGEDKGRQADWEKENLPAPLWIYNSRRQRPKAVSG